jgi:cyclopropane fatty-acyl-phospholipid synthase-like methyltransferase
MRVADDWFVGFHTGLVARFWRVAGATMAERDARVVAELLDLPPGASVIDVPCGDGRIALRLAAAGLRVTGIELAAAEVEHARRAAGEARVGARFHIGDLRDLPDLGAADGLVSWGNSFGYLTPPETARSLAGMHRLLRPGGRLVLESMTVAESLLPREIPEHSEIEFGAIRMTRANRYVPAESRLETDYVFTDEAGTVQHARAAHHVHTVAEVVRMLDDAGFGDVRLLGGDGTTPYALGAPRMIPVATA